MTAIGWNYQHMAPHTQTQRNGPTISSFSSSLLILNATKFLSFSMLLIEKNRIGTTFLLVIVILLATPEGGSCVLLLGPISRRDPTSIQTFLLLKRQCQTCRKVLLMASTMFSLTRSKLKVSQSLIRSTLLKSVRMWRMSFLKRRLAIPHRNRI